MTTAPYSDEWRRHTRQRMRLAGLPVTELVGLAGFAPGVLGEALGGDGPVSLEVAGPVDAILDELEQREEAETAAAMLAAGAGRIYAVHDDGKRERVQRVAVNLGVLTRIGPAGAKA